MFKRMLLGVTMLAVMGVGTFGISSAASAHGCDYGYGPTYRAAYYPTVVSYYAPPQVVYYPSSYAAVRPVIVATHHQHHHYHSGVTLTVGF
ncbi:MAG TPA: hypothetical protein VH107_20210 [Lacipirellulaceae bacterium]|jgi:hypothetical protein|nr:hypothetical protein [Lacipirellulaceae bacterium]